MCISPFISIASQSLQFLIVCQTCIRNHPFDVGCSWSSSISFAFYFPFYYNIQKLFFCVSRHEHMTNHILFYPLSFMVLSVFLVSVIWFKTFSLVLLSVLLTRNILLQNHISKLSRNFCSAFFNTHVTHPYSTTNDNPHIYFYKPFLHTYDHVFRAQYFYFVHECCFCLSDP